MACIFQIDRHTVRLAGTFSDAGDENLQLIPIVDVVRERLQSIEHGGELVACRPPRCNSLVETRDLVESRYQDSELGEAQRLYAVRRITGETRLFDSRRNRP